MRTLGALAFHNTVRHTDTVRHSAHCARSVCVWAHARAAAAVRAVLYMIPKVTAPPLLTA